MAKPVKESNMLVIVDPMSTGATLAFMAASQGHKICCVWSDICPESLRHFVADGQSVEFVGVVNHRAGQLDATLAELALLGTVANVIVGSEPGVELADQISSALGLRGNGLEQSATRRNKFEQSEAVRARGLSAGGQALVTKGAEVEDFISRHCTPFTKAVVKPMDGAASEGVTICTSANQMRSAFGSLKNTTNVFGRTNHEVLLMEYLGGDEFVVDTVSRDGLHKCVAIWKYIKQPCNGVANVFHGQRLMVILSDEDDASCPLRRMVAYIFGVLDAIGIKNGAVHSEVKFDMSTEAGMKRGPVLIETNCRLHGIEGSWKPVVERCLGYSQVSALIDAYREKDDAFAKLPKAPTQPLGHGAQVGVRSTVEGIISKISEERLAKIRATASYCGENLPLTSSLAEGQPIAKTIDIVTLCGQINIAHASKEQLEADLEFIQGLINEGLFETLPLPPPEPRSSPVTLRETFTESASPIFPQPSPKSPKPGTITNPTLMNLLQTVLGGFCIPCQLAKQAEEKEVLGLFEHRRSRALRLSH